MENDYNIRKVNFEELRELVALYEHFEHGDSPIPEGQIQDLWNEIINNPGYHYIVAEVDGKIVSSCNITIIQNLTRSGRPYGLVENVVTHKEYRNLGLGKKVLEEAVRIAKEENCYKVMLMTSSKKEETLNFYRSAGFRDDLKTGFIMKMD